MLPTNNYNQYWCLYIGIQQLITVYIIVWFPVPLYNIYNYCAAVFSVVYVGSIWYVWKFVSPYLRHRSRATIWKEGLEERATILLEHKLYIIIFIDYNRCTVWFYFFSIYDQWQYLVIVIVRARGARGEASPRGAVLGCTHLFLYHNTAQIHRTTDYCQHSFLGPLTRRGRPLVKYALFKYIGHPCAASANHRVVRYYT